jgi:hypothetical protein
LRFNLWSTKAVPAGMMMLWLDCQETPYLHICGKLGDIQSKETFISLRKLQTLNFFDFAFDGCSNVEAYVPDSERNNLGEVWQH